jgi:hypothetical protein
VLNVGDRIMFDFENEPELFGIIPEERDAYENHRVEGNYLFFFVFIHVHSFYAHVSILDLIKVLL